MLRSNQGGGGPWGGGGGPGPWGRGPSGPPQPNLEDLLRRVQDQLRRLLPGGMDKMLIEKAGGSGVVPYLPLDELLKRKPAQPEQKGAQQ